MSNRYALTLLHWITTIIIGSLLSGLLSQLMNLSPNSNSISHHNSSIMAVVVLCVIFSGLFSLPVFLIALFVIPKILNRAYSPQQLQIYFSVISAGFVVAGFLVAGYTLGGLLKTLEEFDYVLIGFFVGAILSSIIWAKMYKPDSNKLARGIDAIDSDLLN